jgi:ATP-dependent helicase/nuclease subunit A
MNRVKIISASAGTGKTTRLARIISEHVADGTARPEAVLATTFTKRAAAELAERARAKLLEAGEPEKAQRLQAARIGTINGVCGALVQDFAFDQGLSPRVTVLEQNQADLELKRVGAQAMPPDLLTEIGELEERFGRNGWDWHAAAVEVVKFARTNGIGGDQFSEMADASEASVLSLFSGEAADAVKLDRALEEALKKYPAAIDLEVDKTKKTATALRDIEAAKKQGVQKLTWSEWAGLANSPFSTKSQVAAEPLIEAASAHDRHPRLKDDVRRGTHAVFRAAQSILES